MKVTLLTHTPDPEKIVAASAKLCYSSATIENLMDNLTEERVNDFLNRLDTYGHESPFEHISFTFGIEGVSRALLAQLTRHRVASFSVQSQRYVRLNGDKKSVVIPDAIKNNPDALQVFTESTDSSFRNYDHLCQILEDMHYANFVADGMNEKEARRKASKLANEDARSVLPNACATNLICTMNVRELNHFFEMRCCNRAQSEIRTMATEMLKLVYPVAPHLFKNAGPSCVRGACAEGAMTCGKAKEVHEFYKNLKEDAV